MTKYRIIKTTKCKATFYNRTVESENFTIQRQYFGCLWLTLDPLGRPSFSSLKYSNPAYETGYFELAQDMLTRFSMGHKKAKITREVVYKHDF